MSWLEKVLEAMQTAAVIGERVERMGGEMAELAVEMRELDRRVSQLEGAFAVMVAKAPAKPPPKSR